MWEQITTVEQADQCLQSLEPLLLLKHSNRCSLSGMVKSRLEKAKDDRLRYVLVDVVADRSLSNHIADKTDVRHESPQSFLIAGGTLHEVSSHMSINGRTISDKLDAISQTEK